MTEIRPEGTRPGGPRGVVEVPVLIVGGGYSGLASAAFLADQNVPCLLVDRHPGVSVQGRARGINQRTMELYRRLGIAEAVRDAARPFAGDAGVARCSSLSAEWEWVYEQEAPQAWPELTPGEFTMADQNAVEPLLIQAARERGADLRFDTELVDLETDEGGATARIQDRSSGETLTVRADHVIAADGHRSAIREQLGIARNGPGVVQHWLSIVADVDLSEIVTRRALFWIVLPPGLGFASAVGTATPGRWSFSITYDPAKESLADFTAERCAGIARTIIGRDDIALDVVDIGAWEQAVGVAERFSVGRVHLVGDAAHVWPPASAMGANSGIQDAHNLAWKLAAVVRGQAGPRLLDSYDAERRPVAEALADLTVRRQQARFGGGTDPADLDDKAVTLGQRYHSSAVLGTTGSAVFCDAMPAPAEPGVRAPHLWLDDQGSRVSVHDLVGPGFVLLTGPDPTGAWANAARAAEVRHYRVGADPVGVDLVDADHTWSERYGLAGGAVLLRPDGFIAWRADNQPADPSAAVREALRSIVDRDAAPQPARR